MKFNKELLIKQRFWLLLGCALFLWFLIFVVALAAGPDAKKAEEAQKKELTTVRGLSDPKNGQFVQTLKEKGDKLSARKDEIHEREWRQQDGMLQWPKFELLTNMKEEPRGLLEVALTEAPFMELFPRDRWEKLPPGSHAMKDALDRKRLEWNYKTLSDALSDYRRDWLKQEIYAKQLKAEGFDDAAEPAYFRGGLKDTSKPEWKNVPEGYKAVLKPIEFKSEPTLEELWYAEEDLTLYRETMRTIQKAIQSVGHFDPAAHFRQVDTFSQDPLVPQIFRNPTWQVELLFERIKAPEGSGSGDLMVISDQSKLVNLRGDDAAARVDGLKLQLQQPPILRGPVPVTIRKPVELLFKGGKTLGPQEAMTFKEAGLVAPKFAAVGADKEGVKELTLTGLGLGETIQLEVLSDPNDGDLPQGWASWQRQHLRSAIWDLEMHLTQKDRDLELQPTSVLTNLHPGRRQMTLSEVKFEARQGDRKVTFTLRGEPVSWGLPVALKDRGMQQPLLLPGFSATEPIEIQQLLTYQTSPVKRIDAVELRERGLAHRTWLQRSDLRMRITEEQIAADSPPTAAAGGGEAQPNAPPPPSTDFTRINNLPRKRYVSKTDQVRRVPVLVVLVIDQAYLADVLVAFTPPNTRMHFHQTQVMWKRLKPSAEDVEKKPEDDKTGGDKKPSDKGTQPSERPGTTPPGTGGTGTPKPGEIDKTKSDPVADVEDPNLLELQIYGLVSLYERFSRAKPEAAK